MSFGVGLWWMWLAIAGIVQVLRVNGRRKQLRRVEQLVRQTRADATDGTTTYREVRPDEATLLAFVRGTETAQQEIEARGFRALGTFVLQRQDGTTIFVSRAFVDEPGTTVAYLGVAAIRPSLVTLICESYTADHTWVTIRRDERGMLAPTPIADRQFVAGNLTFPEAVAAHRAFAPLADESRTFTRLTNAEELIAANRRNHQAHAQWRRGQSPDLLLKEDLVGLLGKHYPQYGKVFLRRLTDELPRATARRA